MRQHGLAHASLCNAAASRGCRVLIVDDNATNRLILDGDPQQLGHAPRSVDGGPAALAALRTPRRRGEPFDLALVDGMMPEMDGFELAGESGMSQRSATTRTC